MRIVHFVPESIFASAIEIHRCQRQSNDAFVLQCDSLENNLAVTKRSSVMCS